MSKEFHFTFKESNPFHGCLQPVYANNKDQAIRLIRVTYGNDWDNVYDAQGARVLKDNSGLVVLDEIGIQ